MNEVSRIITNIILENVEFQGISSESFCTLTGIERKVHHDIVNGKHLLTKEQSIKICKLFCFEDIDLFDLQTSLLKFSNLTKQQEVILSYALTLEENALRASPSVRNCLFKYY